MCVCVCRCMHVYVYVLAAVCCCQAITFPLLLCQGSEDGFVSPSGAEWVYKRSQSSDKKIKRYRGGYHDLLNDSIREQVFDDVVRWLDERVDR